MYDFLACFGMHGICVYVFGSSVVISMGFSYFDSGCILAFAFPDSHGVIGFILG